MSKLLCLGMGYSCKIVAQRIASAGWHVIGTSRTQVGADAISAEGYGGLVFDGNVSNVELDKAITTATHIVVSAPPDAQGDPVLRVLHDRLAASSRLRWLGYLSTIGVYGDWGGAWVDEETPPRPVQERALRRLAIEQAWLDLGNITGVATQIFRIGGIYGPGRNVLEDLLEGTARRIVKPGQVFNRIHVYDMAQSIIAAMNRGRAGRIYNLTDCQPTSSEEVLLYAARLLKMTPPEPILFENAVLSPMAANFYIDNRRVRNQRLLDELQVTLMYNDYQAGLTDIFRGLHLDSKP